MARCKKQSDWDLHQRRVYNARCWDRFDHLWVIDTEYSTVNCRPNPVCICASDILTGRRIEMFFNDGGPVVNPFEAEYERSCFIGHALAAEWGTFIALGWTLPPHCWDTMFEFMCSTNLKMKRDLVTPATTGRSLLDACGYYGITTIGTESKTNERQNIIDHGRAAPPGVTQAEYERRVLDYCFEDVDVTRLLFFRQVKCGNPYQALLRGSYSRPDAWYRHNGVPLNLPWIKKVIKNRDFIRLEIVRKVEEKYGYGAYTVEGDKIKFSEKGAAEMVKRFGLSDVWPRSPKTNKFSFAKDVISDMAKISPELVPFQETRKTESHLKNFALVVTNDGWNRTYNSPFAQKTGRNNPTGGFILSTSKWMRYGIQAPVGHALIACDVRSEEYVIAAAFAEDKAELDEYYSGRDLYMALAIRLEAVPPGANRDTEKDEIKKKFYALMRKIYKQVMLLSQYGGGAKTLAARAGISVLLAEVILADLKILRKKYYDWSDAQVAMARKHGYIETLFGWKMFVYPSLRRGPTTIGTKTTTLINWPVQASGGEILRLASILLERSGYGKYLCCPHHDAIYAFAPLDKVSKVKLAIELAFEKAGDVVMQGKATLMTDTHVYPYPEVYSDEDGEAVFNIATGILDKLPDVTDDEWTELQSELCAKIEANRKKRHKSSLLS
jgi:hypothetical protein